MTHFDRKVRSDRLEGYFRTCAFDTKPFSKLSGVDIVRVYQVGAFAAVVARTCGPLSTKIPNKGTQAELWMEEMNGQVE
jgi:hypothetical protein